jgi:hypothetical protein
MRLNHVETRVLEQVGRSVAVLLSELCSDHALELVQSTHYLSFTLERVISQSLTICTRKGEPI